jgi:Family of unknown function (DUF6232)
MLLNDLINQDDSKKIVENPKFIEFSARTVRWGDSIYQLRNITGFGVGEIPKQKLQILLVLGLIIGGILLLAIGVGIVLLGIAAWMLISHFSQTQKYGFILELNSGGTTSFVSSDRKFLGAISSAFYKLMEGDIDGLTVNWTDRSVTVHGEVRGAISTGDNAKIQHDSQGRGF